MSLIRGRVREKFRRSKVEEFKGLKFEVERFKSSRFKTDFIVNQLPKE
jgi:hypothetical protein